VNNPEPLLSVQIDGVAVDAARIPVAHLLRFLNNMTKAFQRTGRVLQGKSDSVRRGPGPAAISEEVALDLTLLTHGSPSAVLGFERSQSKLSFPQMDSGIDVFEVAIKGLALVQEAGDTLPHGFDRGVLMAWRDAGGLFRQGVERIEFTLNNQDTPLVSEFTPSGFARLQQRIQGPLTNVRTIEGRLIMADFKEHGSRCRIHPSMGEPVLCLFDDAQKDEVLEDILQYVQIVGEAKEDPVTGKITSIQIHDIERMDARDGLGVELLPTGLPLPQDFWDSPSLDELASAQGVSAISNVEMLFGTWPGDTGDGFEGLVEELRHKGMVES
tara:strand:- start:228 stop:1208 length:981 start_codon:yes stop_codon:yes gene_type:complete